MIINGRFITIILLKWLPLQVSMKIIRYTHTYKEKWDAFVELSKNGTFLHLRDYMDYHSDRFDDYSLICVDDKDNILALLPANRVDDTLYSHQGLTYGGWIISIKSVQASTMLEVWNVMNEFLKENGLNRLIYRAVPHIYHRYPAEEDLYAIFRNGGQIYSSLISTTLPLDESRLRFNENARRGMKNAISNGVEVMCSDDWEQYWDVLSEMLKSQYNTTPVHSLEEIKMLSSRFPNNIKLYVAKCGDEVVAGTVVFFTHTVAHAQYIAASDKGKQIKALPLVFDYVIQNECGECRYFDFGTSNEEGGMYLNEGLIMQKCGMGGRGIAYTTYELKIEN